MKARGSSLEYLIATMVALTGTVMIAVIWPRFAVNEVGATDEWFYLQPELDTFKYLSYHLSDTYYFRRWTLMLPTLFLGSLLQNPMEAQFVGGIVEVFLILGLGALFFKKLSGHWVPAVLMSVVVVSEPFFFNQIGSTYSQGPVQVFLLAAAILAVSSNHSGPRKNSAKCRDLLIGISLGLGFVAYQESIIFWPIILMLRGIVFLTTRPADVPWLRSNARQVGSFAANFLGGFLLITTVIDFLILDYLGPRPENIFLKTIKVTLHNHGSGEFGVELGEFMRWAADSPGSSTFWLVVPVLMILFNQYRNDSDLRIATLSSGWLIAWALFAFRTLVGANPFAIDYIRFPLTYFGLGILMVFTFSRLRRFPRIIKVAFLMSAIAAMALKNEIIPAAQSGLWPIVLISIGVAFLLWSRPDSANFGRGFKVSCGLIAMNLGLFLFFPRLAAYDFNKPSSGQASDYVQLASEIARVANAENARVWIWDKRLDESPLIQIYFRDYSAFSVNASPPTGDCRKFNWILSDLPAFVAVVYPSEIEPGQLDSTLIDENFMACGFDIQISQHPNLTRVVSGVEVDFYKIN